jgi:competence protein ComFC
MKLLRQFYGILHTAAWALVDFIFPKSETVKKFEALSPAEFLTQYNPILNKTAELTYYLLPYREEYINNAIWEIKYRKNSTIAALLCKTLYDELLEELSELSVMKNFTDPVLVPIPLSEKRLKERGFNQSEFIVKEILAIDQKRTLSSSTALIKIKDTKSQAESENKQARIQNLKDCFTVQRPEEIKGKNIILIDDVMTTGTTFNETKRTLARAGAKKVMCVALAH